MNRLIVFLLTFACVSMTAIGQQTESAELLVIEASSDFSNRFYQYAPPSLERELPAEIYPQLDEHPVPLNLVDVKSAIEYPREAIDAGFEAELTASILVDANGNYVRHVWLGNPNRYFRTYLDPYLPSIRFAPAQYNGTTVAGWTRIPFSFRLKVPRS